MKYGLIFIALVISISSLFAYDLKTERIRKIENRKKSIFVREGIFHNGQIKVESKLATIRHSFNKKDKVERVVLDFSTQQIPRVYGLLSPKEKKFYLDLFNTELEKGIKSLGTSEYVDGVNFFPIDGDSLSLEISMKDVVHADVFYLESPGRIVIDLKKQ